MAKTVIWNRDEQDFVKSSDRTLVFASSTDADTFLARKAVAQLDSKATKKGTGATTTYDKITVN